MSSRWTRAAACAAAIFTLSGLATPALAQPQPADQQPWTSPYPLRLTADRALALVQAATDNLPYIPGEVLIKFKDGVTVTDQSRALRVLRSRPDASALEWVGTMALLRDRTEPNAELLAARLAQQPEVEFAEPNYLYKQQTTPNDPSFSRQWNFTEIGVDKAWDINPGAKQDVTIAVVDSGVTTINDSVTFPTWDGRQVRRIAVPFATNPDLSSDRLLDGKDFVFWDGPVLDTEGHGTHVSSTIGEDTNNAIGLAGIAYNAKILPLKACLSYWDVQFSLSAAGYTGFAPPNVGACPTDAIVDAVRYAADAGAEVINLSIGGPDSSTAMKDALMYATAHGAFVAVAMGNEYEEGNPVDYPAAFAADIDGVVSVAAVGRSLRRAFYSNTGPHTELAAPGGDERDGGLSGLVWQSGLNPLDSDSSTVIFPRFDRYVELPEQGTSMAAPHVSGVAALIRSQGVTSPAAIEKLLEGTAKDLGAAGRDEEFGYGLIQPRTALRGFGIAR